MILLEGIARSGTSLLARMMAHLLEANGYHYYYEPMKHPTEAGVFEGWEEMLKRVVLPDDPEPALADYIDRQLLASGDRLFWKEIRLTLKQDWLLARYPQMKIVHLTRDIMGVWSSHRREDAPDWMSTHRDIWLEALNHWMRETDQLVSKGLEIQDLPERFAEMGEAGRYALIWRLSEEFALSLDNPRVARIRYEDLCLNPLGIMSEIAGFTGFTIGSADEEAIMRQMAETNIAQDASGPGAGMESGRMPDIWRKRLDPNDLEEIAEIAGSTRLALNYPPV